MSTNHNEMKENTNSLQISQKDTLTLQFGIKAERKKVKR